MLGPYQSPVAYDVSQLAEKEQTPFVITVAVADNITERGFEYTFRVQPNARAMTREEPRPPGRGGAHVSGPRSRRSP